MVSLKLQIDKKAKKILYAEADKDFVDFLFTILSLPITNVIKLLSARNEGTSVGSLTSLQRSADRLDISYFQVNQHKDDLLKPKALVYIQSTVGALLGVEASPSKVYYRCNGTTNTNCRSHFTATKGTPCPACKLKMTIPATYVYGACEAGPKDEGFVKGMVKYLVMDDLTVKPMSSASALSVLREFNVGNVGLVEEKVVHLGYGEAMKLLKASICSSTVLTDVFLPNSNFTNYSGYLQN